MACMLAGALSEYVISELNVLALDTCSDPLAYAELSAVPDWQGLGKRLGKDMGKVGTLRRLLLLLLLSRLLCF